MSFNHVTFIFKAFNGSPLNKVLPQNKVLILRLEFRPPRRIQWSFQSRLLLWVAEPLLRAGGLKVSWIQLSLALQLFSFSPSYLEQSLHTFNTLPVLQAAIQNTQPVTHSIPRLEIHVEPVQKLPAQALGTEMEQPRTPTTMLPFHFIPTPTLFWKLLSFLSFQGIILYLCLSAFSLLLHRLLHAILMSL